MKTLSSLRGELDEIDNEIVSLLNKRMKVIEQVAQVKEEQHLPVMDASRENAIIEIARLQADNPVLKDNIDIIFHGIMDISKAAVVFSRHIDMPIQRVGIIGMGLIGGSIAKGLKTKNRDLKIVSLKWEGPDNILANQSGLLDKEAQSLEELIRDVDLVVIAAPISAVIQIAKEISASKSALQKKLIVIDVASVKGAITKEFEMLSDSSIEFVPTHPIAGTEHNGFKNSKASLFVNAPWIITPHGKISDPALEAVTHFIQFLGAVPISMSPESHDLKTALISHIPGILSKSFLAFVTEKDPSSLQISGPGFKSVTRLAHDNPEMRAEIAAQNKALISEYLDMWVEFLQHNKGGK